MDVANSNSDFLSSYKLPRWVDHSASLVEITDQLSDPPLVGFITLLLYPSTSSCFGSLGDIVLLDDMLNAPFHRRFDPFVQGLAHWNKRRG
uniref:Uncharacterized protein n=1 Tax=Solanum tuberosum TaxID=4113 RepID=M1DPQ3_SOLTU